MFKYSIYKILALILGATIVSITIYNEVNYVNMSAYGYKLSFRNLYSKYIIKNNCFTSVRPDGLGSQLKGIMKSIAFVSKKDKWKFCYSELQETPHGPLHQTTGKAHEIDKFLNMGYGETSIDLCFFCQTDLPEEVKAYSFHDLFDSNTRSILRNKYFQYNHGNYSIPYDKSTFNVAVHIRRDDLYVNTGHSHRLSDDSHYIKAMHDIASNIQAKISFHIFSDSKQRLSMDKFSVHGKYDVTFYMNGDWKSTFDSFVMADALIISKSSFSWNAGVLSYSPFIYYTPPYPEPLETWRLNIPNGMDINDWSWWVERNCTCYQMDYYGNNICYEWGCEGSTNEGTGTLSREYK